jgi:ribosomal protein S3AE
MAERKRFIDVKIPMLGSTMRVLGTPEELHNKTIKLDLTRQLRGKGLTIKFRIINDEGKLVGIPNNMELVTSYIRRMMRKRSDYVEDSFHAQCSDIRVTIKPLLITRKRVSRAVRRNLRNTAREFIIAYLKERDYLETCNEILNGELQKTLLPKLKKVYPLSFCDIRVFETKDLEKIDVKEVVKKAEESVQEVEDIQEVKEEAKEEDIQEVKEEEDETEEKEEVESTKTE